MLSVDELPEVLRAECDKLESAYRMSHAHRHAYRNGFTRLMLDVMPERRPVIDFYRRLGYTDTVPYAPEAFPMIYLERSTSPADNELGRHQC